MSLYGNREFASGNQKPNYANTGNTYGISTGEKSNTGGLNYGPKLTHSGWVLFSLGTGPVGRIDITNAGIGYNANGFLIFSGGNGSGANASFTTDYASGNGQVTKITILSGGTGYNADGFLTFTGGGGTGANASFGRNTVAAAGNTINSVTLISRGRGYTSEPVASVNLSNITIATFATNIANANAVSTITINSGGSGYNAAPTVTANLGNTVMATFTAVLGGRGGRIQNEVLVASGSISGDVDDASGFFTGN